MASHSVKEILAADGSPVMAEVARRDANGRDLTTIGGGLSKYKYMVNANISVNISNSIYFTIVINQLMTSTLVSQLMNLINNLTVGSSMITLLQNLNLLMAGGMKYNLVKSKGVSWSNSTSIVPILTTGSLVLKNGYPIQIDSAFLNLTLGRLYIDATSSTGSTTQYFAYSACLFNGATVYVRELS